MTSKEDEGLAFQLCYPVLQGQTGKQPTDSSAAADRSATDKTILLADDDELVLEVTDMMLKRSGYRVLLARNGREAVDVFRNNLPGISLVILDIMMPEMNGKDALRAIRQMKSDTKILVSSGLEDNGISLAENSSNTSYIQKPYLFKTFIEKVRGIVEAEAIP